LYTKGAIAMMFQKSIFLFVLFLRVLAVVPSHALVVGDVAKDFSLNTNEGETVSLTQYRENAEVCVLEFLDVYCHSCKAKAPSVNRIAKKYKSRGVKVIAVALENDIEEVTQFVKKTGIRFPLLADPDNKTQHLYNITKIPSFFIIDRSGTITYRGSSKTFNSLEKRLGAELNKRTGSIQTGDEAPKTPLSNVGEETEAQSPHALTPQETMGFLRQVMPEAQSIEEMEINGEQIFIGNYPKGKKYYSRFVQKDILCDVCSDVHFVYTLDQEGIYRNILPVISLELYGTPIKGTEFLQQFIGKSHHEVFVAGDNVDTITGATKSSKKVIEGLNETENLFKHYVGESSFDFISRKGPCFKHQAELEESFHRYNSEHSESMVDLDLTALKPYVAGGKIPRCPSAGSYSLIDFNETLRVMCTHHGLDPHESPPAQTGYAQSQQLREAR
jgi:peroxiredoxin